MRRGILLGIFLYLIVAGSGGIFLYFLSIDLPPVSVVRSYRPPLTTKVFDRNGKLLHEFFIEQREPAYFTEFPKHLIQAFISIEDKEFYSHSGLNFKRILKAILVDIIKRRPVQGASTITQQLARNMFLTPEKTLRRKIKEAILALKLERTFSKDEILERYLNQIYFGHGVYGVKAAAKFYFGKDLTELNPSESALLASIPRSPLLYSPLRNPELAEMRRKTVLRMMKKLGYLNEEEYRRWAQKKPELRVEKEKPSPLAPYFIAMVRDYIQRNLGEDFLYESGGRIYTTLDLEMQEIAEEVIDSFLNLFEEIYDLNPKKGEEEVDSLHPPKYLQGALLALDLRTGEILALVGGRDFKESEFNRVTQLKRQAGSAFKPFVYTAALENGFNPSDIVFDIPVALRNGSKDEIWFPENYDEKFWGAIPLRKAIAFSRNLATVNLVLEIGPSTVAEYARRMGITSPIPPYPSVALGAPSLSLLEIVRGYATIANYGVKVEPYFIKRVEDNQGAIILENEPKKVEVLDSTTAYIMIDMMKSVIEWGTGRGAHLKYGFKKPAAGKTGTTNFYRDSWFIGFTPELIAGVWVGYDSVRTIMEDGTGARLALPIWATFMRKVTDTTESGDFIVPEGITWAEICSQSGLLATPDCPDKRLELFKMDNLPLEQCTLHVKTYYKEALSVFDKMEGDFLEFH